METDNQENTLFEIHSDHVFVEAEHHKHLLVSDVRPSYAPDIFGEQSDRSTRTDDGDATPAPEETVLSPFLRITTDHPPISPEVGYMFGSDRSICDILLAKNTDGGVSKRQISLQAQVKSGMGVLILKNHSHNGTCVTSSELHRVKLTSQRSLPPEEREIRIEIGQLRFRIVFPDRSRYEAQWEQHWAIYLATYGHREDVKTYAFSLASTVASKSWEQDYRLWTRLGSGAFGTVHHVVSKRDGRHHAVKCYHKEDETGETGLKVLQSLCHTNIVKFGDFYQDPPALVMELVHGIRLDESYKIVALDRREIRDCTRQLSSAIAYLHSKNITHRDLKPSNIMVNRRRPIEIKLVDFGLATEHPGTLHTFAGTKNYMAPELFRQNPYTRAVDIWALGAIVLELSYGPPQRCNKQDSWPHLLWLHIREQSPNILQEYIEHLLEWKPADRPSAARAREARFPREGIDSEAWNAILDARKLNIASRKEPEVPVTVQQAPHGSTAKPSGRGRSIPSGATTVPNTSYRDGERERSQITARHLPRVEQDGPSHGTKRTRSHQSTSGPGDAESHPETYSQFAEEQRRLVGNSVLPFSLSDSPPRFAPTPQALSWSFIQAMRDQVHAPLPEEDPSESYVPESTRYPLAAPTPKGYETPTYQTLASEESLSSLRGIERGAPAHPSTAGLKPVFSQTTDLTYDSGSFGTLSTRRRSRNSKSTEYETEHDTFGSKA